jgi:hypothetical protein
MTATTLHVPRRHRLPDRRRGETFEFRHAGHDYTLTAGFYRTGDIGEIFLNAHKSGGDLEAVARDAAIIVSLALQYGADLARIRNGVTRDSDGGPATLIGAALDAIEEGRR